MGFLASAFFAEHKGGALLTREQYPVSEVSKAAVTTNVSTL